MPKPFPQFEIEPNIYCIKFSNWNINQNSGKAFSPMINSLLDTEIKVFKTQSVGAR